MKDYATIDHTSGIFPYVIGINSSGPGVLDGTPYIGQFIDDIWGAAQGLMNAASMTPNAVTESATASQRLEALRRISGYPGETVSWHGNAIDPSALGIRLLPLNGQGVLVASYPELVTSCYVGDPDNPTASVYYRADDAAGTIRNVAGIYFILPDMRGAFARGLDVSGTVDPDGASRDIGNLQDWSIYDHYHLAGQYPAISELATTDAFDKSGLGAGADKFIFSAGATIDSLVMATTMRTTVNGSVSSTNRSTEGRPVNVTGRWCIRY